MTHFQVLHAVVAVLCLLLIAFNAWELGLDLFFRIRLALSDRKHRKEEKHLPLVPMRTPEQVAKRHRELLEAGYTYVPAFGAYTKPVNRPARE